MSTPTSAGTIGPCPSLLKVMNARSTTKTFPVAGEVYALISMLSLTYNEAELVILVLKKNVSVFARSNLYATADNTSGTNVLTMIEQTDSLNPVEYTGGFIIPTDAIHVGLDTTGDWGGELDVGFLFEVHTEKLSLRRIQELLVSLTAN